LNNICLKENFPNLINNFYEGDKENSWHIVFKILMQNIEVEAKIVKSENCENKFSKISANCFMFPWQHWVQKVCYSGTYIHTESCIDYYIHHGDMRFTEKSVFGTLCLGALTIWLPVLAWFTVSFVTFELISGQTVWPKWEH